MVQGVSLPIGRLTNSKVQANILSCWFSGSKPETKEGTRRRQLREAVAAPATVSGEPIVQHTATGKPGRPDERQRPASQETCQRSHPTGGRGVHTERSFER